MVAKFMAGPVEILIERLQNLNPIEYFTFAVNALVFVFSKQIARMHGEDDPRRGDQQRGAASVQVAWRGQEPAEDDFEALSRES